MPCTDLYPATAIVSYPEDQQKIKFLTALCCGLMKARIKSIIEEVGLSENGALNEVLCELNYLEMGISEKKIREWWENHLEEEKKYEKNIYNSIFSKLTNEEKNVLRKYWNIDS